MADGLKNPPPTDLRSIISLVRRRRTRAFAYGFALTFLACTAYIAFSPYFAGSPWVSTFVSSADYYRSHLGSFLASASASTSSYRSQFSALFSNFFSNSSSPHGRPTGPLGADPESSILGTGGASSGDDPSGAQILERNSTRSGLGSPKVSRNATSSGDGSPAGLPQRIFGGSQRLNQTTVAAKKVGGNSTGGSPKDGSPSKSKSPLLSTQGAMNQTERPGDTSNKSGSSFGNQNSTLKTISSEKNKTADTTIVPPAPVGKSERNQSSAARPLVKQSPVSSKVVSGSGSKPKWNIESMKKCDLFHGKWVRDDKYPMYSPGSCSHIDESFNCFLNGRPELSFQKLRWQPHGCYIPRLNATDMLERLRGKRLVFVGDSLNRNMWESLVCILTSSVKDKSKVFEASGRHEFKTDGSYSFIFKDYNCTVEFFRSVFLVQEWEMLDTSGKEKETLRLDMIAKSSSRYKDADIIVFNTGHWWTHEKTAKGKDYYQEGNRVYNQLSVVDAFHKALNTWAKWVDANVNPSKTLVFFRGYSASHFSGGQWNSGGQCDAESEPIMNEKYLAPYPPKMDVLEAVLRGMKTPVMYLNITRMTDYRKDAHPSIYGKPNLTEAERKAPNRYQDCSHWCLPGVPDSWNDLLYAKLMIEQHKQQ